MFRIPRFASWAVLCYASLVAVAHASEAHAPTSVKKRIVESVNHRLAETPPTADSPKGHAAASGAHTAVAPSTDTPSVASKPHGESGAHSPESVWDELLSGNGRFISGRTQQRPVVAQRAELVQAQHPTAIVLACADSRVSPELLFDQSLGDLFVVRTAGNVADPVALGSIEYAVEHLGAHVLIVLGHEKCGAVKAALSGEKMPSTNLQAIVDHITPALEKPRTCFEGEELVSRCVASNVHQSLRDLLAHSDILREHVESKQLVTYKAVYDLKSGQIRPIE